MEIGICLRNESDGGTVMLFFCRMGSGAVGLLRKVYIGIVILFIAFYLFPVLLANSLLVLTYKIVLQHLGNEDDCHTLHRWIIPACHTFLSKKD